MDKHTLTAQKRDVVGRKVKTLRAQGLLPANIYGKKVKSQSISVGLKDFEEIFKKAGETSLVTLVLKNGKSEERAVLISNVQKDPISETPIHIDFRQVDLKEKVTAEVPVELKGESPAEKTSVGTVVQYIDEIEVEALPGDLPEKFVVDVSSLAEVDQAFFVKDLEIDKAKVILKVAPEEIVVKVEPPQKEEEVAPPPAAEVPVEGAVPAEGGAEAPAEETAVAVEEKKETPAPKE
jgi:large subunit ribosomal protein L25